MVTKKIFESFEQCLAQIENDFAVDLLTNSTHRTLMLRGENSLYPKTESSMKRYLTADDSKTMQPFYYVSPFIDFEEAYAEFHSEEHDLTEEEGVGFLQHYGFPTDLFDLSPSVDTARFFASHEGQKEPLAMIGVFPRANLESHFTLTDLSKHPVALRPQRQLAYAARPLTGIIDLKDSRCETLLESRWYCFRKSDADTEFAQTQITTVYPKESELTYFFGRDFFEFFRNHWAYEKMTEEHRGLVEEKLNTVWSQLR